MPRSAVFLPLLALTGCVLNPGAGPDLGACAALPDGTYTFGEAGIGTCLAGPADLQFFEQGGKTWLAVSNADPFRNFSSGSLLMVDVGTIDTTIRRNTLDTVEAHAVPAEPYLGGIAMVSGDRAIVASRFSEGSFTRDDDDHVWVFDLSDASSPVLDADADQIAVREDPWAIAVDETGDRAFVVNATDHSISVLDASESPIVPLDTAASSLFTRVQIDDADGSGSSIALAGAKLPDADITSTDAWTATWVEGTTRAWVPTDGGLERWTTGGLDWQVSAFGLEVDPSTSDLFSEVRDPWLVTSVAIPQLYWSDEGRLVRASTDGTAGTWSLADNNLLTGSNGWDAWIDGPSVVSTQGAVFLYYTGRIADSADGSIGLATTTDSIEFDSAGDPILTPAAPYESFEQPSVLVDPITGSLRMWLSMWDGSAWTIGMSESSNVGSSWSTPTEVLSIDGGHAAAPVVTWSNGRYHMWLTHDDGGWSHATATSPDGSTWSTPDPFFSIDDPTDLAEVPRVAIQSAPLGVWRLEGDTTGVSSDVAISGTQFINLSHGWYFRVAHGYDVPATVFGDRSLFGVEPGTLVDVDGFETLYVTNTDPDGRTRIGVLRQLVDSWIPLDDDLIPEGIGGNELGARSPLVFELDGSWHMLYGAVGADDAIHMRHASSDDGLAWTADGDVLIPEPAGWDRVEQLPHSVETTDEGLRIWYAGFDGSRYRIGAALTTDGSTLTPEPGVNDAFRFGLGEPGAFDDSGVRDPYIVVDGDTAQMWYSASDDTTWRVGYATRDSAGLWTRAVSPLDELPIAALGPAERTFSTRGVRSVVQGADGTFWYAGTDGEAWRIGRAEAVGRVLFPDQRVPTPGDQVTFDAVRGEAGVSQIDLAQRIGGISLPGANGALSELIDGPAAVAYDADRGFLYVLTKTQDDVIVVDVRDDSTADWRDLNYLDIETLIHVETTIGGQTWRSLVVTDDGRMYLGAATPESILVLDLDQVEDDADKEVLRTAPIGALPMRDASDDAGEITFSRAGPYGLALVPGTDLLIATHFRDNSVSVFDLSLGVVGEEVRYIPDVGENPSVVRVSPDGSLAVIANYVGAVRDGVAEANLAFLDLDPANDTYLEIVTWLANR